MSSVSNVKFSYLYRDGGNFKQFGSVVFSNQSNAELKALEDGLSAALIDGLFFDPASARVPALFFDNFPFDPDLDHSWHELAGITYTNEEMNDAHLRDAATFVQELSISVRRQA